MDRRKKLGSEEFLITKLNIPKLQQLTSNLIICWESVYPSPKAMNTFEIHRHSIYHHIIAIIPLVVVFSTIVIIGMHPHLHSCSL